jgi:hypothetical protein
VRVVQGGGAPVHAPGTAEGRAIWAAVYGGTAGEPYDPCYHQACDTFENLNGEVFDQMAGAAAHVTVQLARTRGGIVDGANVKRDRGEDDHRGHDSVR